MDWADDRRVIRHGVNAVQGQGLAIPSQSRTHTCRTKMQQRLPPQSRRCRAAQHAGQCCSGIGCSAFARKTGQVAAATRVGPVHYTHHRVSTQQVLQGVTGYEYAAAIPECGRHVQQAAHLPRHQRRPSESPSPRAKQLKLSRELHLSARSSTEYLRPAKQKYWTSTSLEQETSLRQLDATTSTWKTG